jgi:hypothetical protein
MLKVPHGQRLSLKTKNGNPFYKREKKTVSARQRVDNWGDTKIPNIILCNKFSKIE